MVHYLFSRSRIRDLLVLGCLMLSQWHAVAFTAGIALFLTGISLRLWAKGLLLRNQEVTDSGPYAICRHPFYLGSLVLDLAIPLMAGIPWLSVIYLPVFLLVYLPTMRKEERLMTRRFGESYQAYQRRIPLLFPRWPAGRGLRFGEWRMDTILKEREASRTLRLMALPFLLLWAAEVRIDWWECLESETLLLLSSALFLHVAGRLVYMTREREKAPHRILRARLGGIAVASLVSLFGLLELRLLGLEELHQQARKTGAIAVETEAEFHARVRGASGDLLIVSDDVMETSSESLGKYVVEDIFWSDFEVFFLVRPNGAPPSLDLSSTRHTSTVSMLPQRMLAILRAYEHSHCTDQPDAPSRSFC